ncbi:MAG: hypothetical protein ACTSQK_12075 [Candidatus Heimdallarchaeota archaeon]
MYSLGILWVLLEDISLLKRTVGLEYYPGITHKISFLIIFDENHGDSLV